MRFRVGIGGNYYLRSESPDELRDACEKIGKSSRSVYWNDKYGCWVVRIKATRHKRKLKELLDSSALVV